MNVIEELEEKINTYIEEQDESIQNNFDEIENIKNDIEFKVYIAKKIIDLNDIEIDDDSISYKYYSKNNCSLNIDTNVKLLYKNSPFFIINKEAILSLEDDEENNFNKKFLTPFYDDEKKYYASILLALNQNWDDLNKTNQFWFFIPNCEIVENNLESFIQFILLTNGKIFHNPIETQKNQFLSSDIKDILDCNIKSFNQYQESAYILSEYNHTKDILLKYLLLYHIIENFMYRRPIAEMATTKLIIRDFKSLYKKVNDSEEKTLKELLNKIKNENIITTTKIEDYFNGNITSFKNELINEDEINEILSKITLQNLNGIKYENASKLIYFFRNSIIHNKETEFHITHTILNNSPDLVKFFEEFLLPTLENIIYFLIFKENSIIDYLKNHLLLYGEACES